MTLTQAAAGARIGAAPESGGPVARGMLEDLAAASRILVDQGVFDAAGHVSMRHPGAADRFLMSRSLAPALGARPTTSWSSTLDCEPCEARGRNGFLERFIHGEIYRRAAGRDGGGAQPFGLGDPVRPDAARRCAPPITTPPSWPPARRCSTSATSSAPPTSS